jgi:hypothetical protein
MLPRYWFSTEETSRATVTANTMNHKSKYRKSGLEGAMVAQAFRCHAEMFQVGRSIRSSAIGEK